MVAAVATIVLLLHAGRGRTFYYDEWDWVQHRHDGGIRTVLEAHNNHISVLPVLLYKGLFETVGLAPVWPYRTLAAVSHVLCGIVLFPIAARRVGIFGGVMVAVLVLGLGAAWEATIWGIAASFSLSLLGGLVAWDALDRDRPSSPPVAAAALMVAVASHSFGSLLAVGVAVELAVQRRWRQLWVPLVPLGLVAIWTVVYAGSDVTSAGVRGAVPWAVEAAAASAGGIVGRQLPWGVVVLLALAAAAVVGVARRGASARLVGLLVVAATSWLATGAARSAPPRPAPPDASRYIELGAPLLLLIVAECWRTARVPRNLAVRAALAAGVLVCVGLGIELLNTGSRGLRLNSDAVRADLAVLEILRATVPS